MKRNPAVELYRVFLMFGICLLHACILPGYARPWLINICCWCVDGFVFITGYYGCQFRPSKVVRLWSMAVVCAMICSQGDWGKAWAYFNGYWFLHAYVLMMCLAPLVQKVNLSFALPLLLAVFVWGDLPRLPFFSSLNIPVTSGLEDFSGLTLFGVYLAGRLYRQWELDKRMRLKYVLPVLMASLGMAALGMNEYNNLNAVIVSASAFYVFSKLPIADSQSWCSFASLIFLLAPSMFSVYLLHQPRIDWELSFVREHVDAGWNIYLCNLAAAALAFTIAVGVDLPRRLLSWLLRTPIQRVLAFIDNLWLMTIEHAENWVVSSK